MTREEAISLLEGEIIRCRMAQKINGCQMTEDWQRTIEVCQIAIDAIREQEQRRWIPVDAVEVVRYRDCKHQTVMWCWRVEEGMNPRRVGSNDFCSYGERKDGDGYGNCLVHPGADIRGNSDGGGIVHHCQR